MATVVKKGGLDVKRKNRIGPPYKRKYVILRRNTTEGTKLVEIYDSENFESEKECITLNGIWTVQDRESQNKKRFAFELVIGAHVVMTFSCPSLLERSEWTESFRILNSISSSSPVPPMEDMYHVILEHNVYSAEIGIFGACLLRVQDGSIVLYSEDGSRKLHHWAFDIVDNISMAGDQVILDAHRPGTSDAPMQFRLNTDFNSSRNILIACSMLLAKDKKRLSSLSLNNVGISVSPADPVPSKSQSLSKGFLSHVKQSNKSFSTKDDKVIRRAKSFNGKTSHSIRRSLSPDACIMGSVQSIGSQEAYAINRPHSPQTKDEGSPPPIPPRAPRRPRSDTIERLDPDYSYIKDDIDGHTTRNKSTSSNGNESLDQQLDDLLRDIEEENRVKKRRQTYTHNNHINPYAEIGPSRTAKTLRPKTTTTTTTKAVEDFEKKRKEFLQLYGDRGASDYIEPVPSKNKRSSSPAHYRDWTGVNGSMTKRLSSSTEYSTSVSHNIGSSSHDYHTIPDNPIKPVHGHTSSMDSTHTESVVISSDSVWGRTQSSSDDPPSPPLPPRPSYLTQLPPTKQNYVSSTNRKGDISPYAIAKGLIVQSESSPAPAPPLPPRSPNKYQRERISIQSTNPANSRCQKCNGVKSTRLSTVRQPHRLPPSPPLDDNGTTTYKPRPKSQPPIETDKESMSAMYGYGSEIDSALAMLDDCVKGLTIDLDTANNTTTSPKSSNTSLQTTDIDQAIKCAREVGSELSQFPVKRATSLYSNHTHKVAANPYVPPRSEVSLVHGGTQTTPTRRFHSPTSASSISTMNGSHHMPLTRFHSSMLPSELSSSTVRAHDIRYN